MKKGDIVKLNDDRCFTDKSGGKLKYPRTNYSDDESGTLRAARPVTPEETSAWYESDASNGMNDAGESKLPPQSISVILHRDRMYQVLRARCRVRLGWGNPAPGMTKILCTSTGEVAYVKRDLLEVVE